VAIQARLLAAKLGEGAAFDLNVTYVEALDPQAALPTPEVCLARVNAVLADRKITFEPGSAEIEGPSLRTMDLLAEALEDCDAVPMEIGAHSDAQGREEMNLRLSQQRADAVLSALQARRVLVSNLAAVGYGESRPVADNGTEAGREANRRIEFTLAGAEGGVSAGSEDQAPPPETGTEPEPEAGGATGDVNE
jgi:OOP family OmpA-OmpF porin